MHTSQMIETNPAQAVLAAPQLSACIEACFDCAQACAACADACLGEQDIAMLRRCIRLNQDCADICIATGRILSRQQQPDLRILGRQIHSCLLACELCAEECAKHHHEHCRVCADACRACAKACQDAIGALGPTSHSIKH
jgi:hypothetical protein